LCLYCQEFWIKAKCCFVEADVEKGPIAILVVGLAVLAAGMVRFIHSGHFAMVQLLHCALAVPGALVLLLIADYTLHHARLAFLIVLAMFVMLAVISPSFCVGLGVALAGITLKQLRG
jgi:hypothetical protein